MSEHSAENDALAVVRAVEAELDDADQWADTLQRPNRISVWGVRRVLARFGGKAHRFPFPGPDTQASPYVVTASMRLNYIAQMHHKHVDESGGTTGDCNECGWGWPCPTYRWATAEGLTATCAWEASDCEEDGCTCVASPAKTGDER
jgi:hypothetical protein